MVRISERLVYARNAVVTLSTYTRFPAVCVFFALGLHPLRFWSIIAFHASYRRHRLSGQRQDDPDLARGKGSLCPWCISTFSSGVRAGRRRIRRAFATGVRKRSPATPGSSTAASRPRPSPQPAARRRHRLPATRAPELSVAHRLALDLRAGRRPSRSAGGLPRAVRLRPVRAGLALRDSDPSAGRGDTPCARTRGPGRPPAQRPGDRGLSGR